MLKLDISVFSDSITSDKRTVTAEELGLEDSKEFSNDINIEFNINKVGAEFFLKTHLVTNAMLECDRCLEPFQYDIDEEIDIIFTPNADIYNESEDDVYPIVDSSNIIDVSESVRQALLIAVPYKHVCDESCKGLCSKCGKNLNTGACDCKTDTIDPRWEALKNIKFNS